MFAAPIAPAMLFGAPPVRFTAKSADRRGRRPGLLPTSRLQSADPSVWISSGLITRGPFEVDPHAQEVLIWETSGVPRLSSRYKNIGPIVTIFNRRGMGY